MNRLFRQEVVIVLPKYKSKITIFKIGKSKSVKESKKPYCFSVRLAKSLSIVPLSLGSLVLLSWA